MFGLRTLCHSRSLEAIRLQLRIRTSRYQSTGNCLCLLPRIHRSLVLTRNAAAVSSVNSLSPALLERARSIFAEHSQLSKDLANEYDITVARKLGELSSTAKALEHWESAQKVCATYSEESDSVDALQSLSELEQLLKDPSTDQELRTLAREEIQNTSQSLSRLMSQLQSSLVPAHPFADLPCLLEIRPGVGGSEAGIFVGDLMQMYQAFCKRHHLRCSILKLEESAARTGAGHHKAIQEVVLEVEAAGAYSLLMSEAGVHRVQRIPHTESGGRIHSSVASVLILPRFPDDEVEGQEGDSVNNPSSDYYVDPKDVKSEIMRSSGSGGQHVNTTDSAIRLTHIPTNIVVSMQDQRSQQKNRTKAWQLLRGKIAAARREAREEEKAKLRLSVLGGGKSASRGDKIRTYNWREQRVTDHRSGITLHQLDNILEGGDGLDKVIESVRAGFRERDIKALIADQEIMAVNHASKAK